MASHYPVEPIPNIFDHYTPAAIQLSTPDKMNEKRRVNDTHDHDADETVAEPLVLPSHQHKVAVESMEILQYLMNSLSGKDKTAKVIRYILQLLRMFTTKFVARNRRKFGSLETLSKGYNFQVLKQILIQPRLLSFLVFRSIDRKLEYVISQLGTYRYILRFGSSPFLLYDLIKKMKSVLSLSRKKGISPQRSLCTVFGNESSVRELVNFYYTICDELVVLHKLKLWKNDALYNTIERHEALTWQFDIVFSFKDLWVKMEELQRKEFEYSIELQVKERAATLYGDSFRDMHRSPIRKQLMHDLHNEKEEYGTSSVNLRKKLEAIRLDKKLLYLDLVKLSFDACANSIDVFHFDTPAIVYPVLSLGSGIAGLIKLWKQAEQDIKKQKAAED